FLPLQAVYEQFDSVKLFDRQAKASFINIMFYCLADEYKLFMAISALIENLPDAVLLDKLNLTPKELKDLKDRTKEMKNTFNELVSEILNLLKPDISQQSIDIADPGNNAALSFRARIELLSSDFDAAGALVANRREDKKLAERIEQMNETTAASAGQILKQALANGRVSRIDQAKIITAQNALTVAAQNGSQSEILAALDNYKNTLINAGLLAGDDDIKNFEDMQEAFGIAMQNSTNWNNDLLGTMPAGFESIPDQKTQMDLLTGIFVLRSIDLLSSPPTLSFHETAIEQNFSASNIGDLSNARSQEIFARCLVGQWFTIDPQEAEKNSSLLLVNPATYNKLADQASAYAAAGTKEDQDKIIKEIAATANIPESVVVNTVTALADAKNKGNEANAYRSFITLSREMQL
ncbi:hypothetical protein NO1_2248, partial [Candidatus Termititenax aidoneus]